jgi:hypothetical protein
MLIIWGKSSIYAKAESIVSANEKTTYQIDLDMNGTKDKIELKQYLVSKDMNGNYYGILYINGNKVYVTSKTNNGYGIEMNFITCKDQVLINLRQSTDNDIMVFNKLLYFKNNEVKEAVDFKQMEPGMRSCKVVKVANDEITVQCEAQPCQLASVLWKSTYTVQGNSVKLKSAVHKVESGIKNHSVSSFVTNRALTFTDKIGSKKAVFTLKADQKVNLLSITTRKNGEIYGYFQYGKKKGYLRVDPYYDTPYFKHVYEYLAG